MVDPRREHPGVQNVLHLRAVSPRAPHDLPEPATRLDQLEPIMGELC